MPLIKDGTITYGIVKNTLQTDPQMYNAKVIHNLRIKGINDLVAKINESTLVSATTIRQVIDALGVSIEYFLKDGYVVQIPGLLSARLQLSVPANQTDPNYVITADNANLSIDARMPLSILESIKQRVNYEKEIIPKKVPVIEDFELLSHPGTHNALTSDTSNNTYRITGENLKFDPTDPLQGIFFRRADEVEQKSLAVPWKMTDRFLETEGIAIAADNPSATLPVVNWPVTLIVRAKYTPNGTLREGIYSTPIVDYDSL